MAFAVTQEWVATYNGPGNNNDQLQKIALDPSGNIYITGNVYGSGTDQDYATLKYAPNGTQLWVQIYNGLSNGQDYANAIAVDSSGNVYVTGRTIDNLTTDQDYTTIKYDTDGNQLWVSKYNGPGNGGDGAAAIAVDSSGNVYVTGYSKGSGTENDYATIKYDSSGNQLWVARYDNSNNYDNANAIAVDSSGNVYVTGSSGTGPTGNYHDYATIKYNSSGGQQWVARYNGPGADSDYANSIVLDSSGNVYVTGGSTGSGTSVDYATIKYNSSGDQQWVARYNGPGNSGDVAYGLAVDSSGNVYIAGDSAGSGTNSDFATIKYDSAGAEQWVARYNGPGNGGDYAYSMAIDSSGNVYVAGSSWGSGTLYDFETIKYDTNGNESWAVRYDDPFNSDDGGRAIAIDGSGDIYAAGWISSHAGKGTYQDLGVIKYFEDLVAPSVFSVWPAEVLDGTTVEFMANATDNVAVSGCDFYYDGSNQSAMSSLGGGVWAANYTVVGSGSHYAWANCTDAANNTNKTNTAVTVNTIPPHTYSQDYDGSADPAAYTATFGGNETAGYDWANAAKIHVPTFTTGWILLNLSLPSGVTEATLAVFKYNGTDTTQMTAGAYGEIDKYNVTGDRIYINVTASDPDFGGVGPAGGGSVVGGGTYAAPESPLAVATVFGLAAIVLAFLVTRKNR
jgi:uncharacterized delta-60 repeat protein